MSLWCTGSLGFCSNPDHVISGCGSSGLAREENVTWRHSKGTSWSEIISSLLCRSIKPQAVKVWKHSPHSPVFPGIHKYGFCWKVLFFDESAKFTYSKIVNIQGSQPLCVRVYGCGRMCLLKYFLDPCPLHALMVIMTVRDPSWKAVMSGFSPIAIPYVNSNQLSEEVRFGVPWICPVYMRLSWCVYVRASLPCLKWFQFNWWVRHWLLIRL